MNKDEIGKKIVESRNRDLAVDLSEYPEPGKYVITGIQMGNIHGEKGYDSYFGYVVQVRKEAGSFGTDIVLIRHPSGKLSCHENQHFYYVDSDTEKLIKSLEVEELGRPNYEDYSKPYTIGDKFPEIGKVIEFKEKQSNSKIDPVSITVCKSDGSKEITTII